MLHTILRLPNVLKARGRSRSSHYNDVKQGLFTDPVQIGLRAIGWPADEVAALNVARISGKTDDEIRQLVKSLHTKRKELLEALGVAIRPDCRPRAIGWPATEIEALNAARISGKTDDEIRLLVRQLETARKTVI